MRSKNESQNGTKRFALHFGRNACIIFGVDDSKHIVGIDDVEQCCLNIENMINDNIFPVPDYEIEINKNNTICLKVLEGSYKPYLYKNKAYRRNDSSSIEVDRMEYQRLVLEGKNQTFEEQISKDQHLIFHVFEHIMKEKINIEKLSTDIFKTLELMTPGMEYNCAAALVADKNHFKGIDIVRFGAGISEIRERKILEHISIFTMFNETMEMFQRNYQYEKIDGVTREKIDMIPLKAFREAIANALIHRLWDVDAYSKISMFEDRIEITSPGTLLSGISIDEYLNGQASMLRNSIIGNIFFRLKYFEKFGTGIRRINESYKDKLRKPVYQVFENSILVVLPVLAKDEELDQDEQLIVDILMDKKVLKRSQIDIATGFQKTKTVRILNRLTTRNIVKKTGNSWDIRYSLY